MIPVFEEELLYGETTEEERLPGLTWKLNENTKRITKRIDGEEALRQAIFCMLRVERFDHEIYSEDYGAELRGRFGQPLEFVTMEMEETITDTLLTDDRIAAVTDFVFTTLKQGIAVQFTVETTEGRYLEMEWEVKYSGGVSNDTGK